ncbi:MAG: hypothetical protein ACTSUE_12350 [Promethearchaeota archaeon]
MSKLQIRFQSVWNRDFKKNVYSCAIANLIGDPRPEIIGCAFSCEMKVFNLKGQEIFDSEFSPNITCFKPATVHTDHEIELVSGDLDGYVHLMDARGKAIWNTNVKDPVLCMAMGDLKGDSRNEVVVGLDNCKVFALDNDGNIILEFKTEETVVDVTVGKFVTDDDNTIFVLLSSGNILKVDLEGSSTVIMQVDSNSSSLSFLSLFKVPILAVGTKGGNLLLFDESGDVVGKTKLDGKVRCLDSFSDDESDEMLIVAASGRELYFFKLREEKLEKQVKESRETRRLTAHVKRMGKQGTPISGDGSRTGARGKDVADVKVLRGGQVEGSEYIFKVKVVNEGRYNITDVTIHIISYPDESLVLDRVEGHKSSEPERVKIRKITRGGFVSPSFIFRPKKDCVKGTIHAIVSFINEEDEVETVTVKPHEIRMICGLLRPKSLEKEEFDALAKDVISFHRIGEEITINQETEDVFNNFLEILKEKHFEIIDLEKEVIEQKFFGIIKGFAEGSFSKNQVGIQLNLTGKEGSRRSTLRVDLYTQDRDMGAPILSELEESIKETRCPNCNDVLAPGLIKGIMDGDTVYCEFCGADLSGRTDIFKEK